MRRPEGVDRGGQVPLCADASESDLPPKPVQILCEDSAGEDDYSPDDPAAERGRVA